MHTITKYLVLLILCLVLTQANGQDTIQKANEQERKVEINTLLELKETIKNQEREFLKIEVEAINQKLDAGEITREEADELKSKVAQKRALNIENRLAIIDLKIEVLKRNKDEFYSKKETVFGINISNRTFDVKRESKPIKYDIRTSNDFLFAIGFNNALIDGESLGDTYEIMGSGFVELGWNWKTRLLKNSNFIRLKYGFSFQWNKLNIKDNQYFVQNNNTTTLEQFPSDLRKSQLRTTNLVFPIYFEFGPSIKLEKETHIRYVNNHKFKIGLGGYAGFNIATQQKLHYKQDGNHVKEKIRRNYNTSPFIYGLGAYIGVGDTSLYIKYDLNTLFKDQDIDQNNVSLGLRFDID